MSTNRKQDADAADVTMVRVPKSLAERVQHIAEREHRSFAGQVRHALELHVSSCEAEKDAA